MKKPEHKKFLKYLLFVNMISSLFIFSRCEKNEETAAKTLEYIESFGEDALSGISVEQMEISKNGEIFLIENNALANGADIHYFNNDYSYGGLFKDTLDNPVKAKIMIFDNGNKLHLADFILFSGTKHMIYETNGKQVREEMMGNISLFRLAIDLDENEENLFVIPVLQSRNEDIFILKYDLLQNDTTLYITSNEINNMIPNYEEGHEYMFAGVCVRNGKIYISVDKEDGDGQGDGLLILDDEFNFIRYVGGNWLFNGPRGIDVDSNGNIYIANVYADNVKVLNSQYKLVAQNTPDNEGGSLNGKTKNPTEVEIYNNKVYVFDAGNYRINIYNTIH